MTELAKKHEIDLATFSKQVRGAYEQLDNAFCSPDYQVINLRGIPTQTDEHQTISVFATLDGAVMGKGATISVVPTIAGFPTQTFTKQVGFDLWTEQVYSSDTPPTTLTTSALSQYTQNLLQTPPNDPSFTILDSKITDDTLIYQGFIDAYYDKAESKERIASFSYADEHIGRDGTVTNVNEITLGMVDTNGTCSHFLATDIPYTLETGLSDEVDEFGNHMLTPTTREAVITVRVEVLDNGEFLIEASMIDSERDSVIPISLHDTSAVIDHLKIRLYELMDSKQNSSGFNFSIS